MSKGRLIRLLSALSVTAGALLLAAPLALAADGVGTGGPADDKKVTYWGFGVMIFFAILVVVLSLIQIRLESRKERAREELERLRGP